jgi:hypothetical protein
MIDMRNILPNRSRQLLRATFEHVLGSRWKAIAFRHIDRTSLQELSKRRIFEPELKLAPLFISKVVPVFDIGANTGEYSYVFERTVGSHCTYAIEPVRQLSSRLKRLFPDVKVLSIALSDTRDTQNLKIPIVNGKPLLSRSANRTKRRLPWGLL